MLFGVAPNDWVVGVQVGTTKLENFAAICRGRRSSRGADHALPGRDPFRRLAIHAADVGDPVIALFGRLVGGGGEPIPNQVWFEIGFF